MDVLPAVSVAMHVTGVVPTEKAAVGGEQTVVAPQLSLTVGGG